MNGIQNYDRYYIGVVLYQLSYQVNCELIDYLCVHFCNIFADDEYSLFLELTVYAPYHLLNVRTKCQVDKSQEQGI